MFSPKQHKDARPHRPIDQHGLPRHLVVARYERLVRRKSRVAPLRRTSNLFTFLSTLCDSTLAIAVNYGVSQNINIVAPVGLGVPRLAL
ncbi:unnamed protein product [Chondrus crispus]|uniref:Uncharacterized protein n=1 Tax=Chondrus crispus TaxID=2769 RepID=R7Q7B5_CHOCR|nr:unnamed protein product [Chondrus crispus]CDF33360.1 unnamed protein product [Chondrus crispus]|eukprot:XP_005713163.1 unnamed protein product [Chondrus crispus]